MKTLPDNSVDAIVTDPPYGISFMAKKWDYDVPSVDVWKESMRVLKPGGHALIACGTRTQHRMVCNIEDAGFEIRDVVSWIYGSGFPKSLNISKAIDKAAGAEREVVGDGDRETLNAMGDGLKNRCKNCGKPFFSANPCKCPKPAPATEAAKQWDGWGSALKPACEFFTLCRKPLSESTVAKNVLKWGTGGINIDGCRVGTDDKLSFGSRELGDGVKYGKCKPTTEGEQNPQGRFPANLIHSGDQEVLELFPETKGDSKNRKPRGNNAGGDKFKTTKAFTTTGHSDQGSAARFFYCAKASKKDRDEGNNHPTVKPTALMQYLCRLITPPQGIVLDPFMGSGSTGKAAIKEGFSFVGCELDADYFEIAKARIHSHNQSDDGA